MKANNRDVQRISNLARGYERNLCGRDFLICYGEEGNTRMLEVAFSKKRFNHLVGIDIGQCHIKPWVLYKKALAGTLKPRDLGSSLSQYFPTKALAARMMNAFASSATHVSKVNPLSTRVNAEIWISGDAAQFAVGCLKVNAEYHSSSCYVPSSLQLLKPERVDMKSSGERMPIVAKLSKEASAKGSDTLLYVNEELLESSRDSLGFIIRSFGDTDALRTSYPVLMDTIMGLDPNRDISLDDLCEDRTDLAHELDELNRRRESFRNTLSHSPANKDDR